LPLDTPVYPRWQAVDCNMFGDVEVRSGSKTEVVA